MKRSSNNLFPSVSNIVNENQHFAKKNEDDLSSATHWLNIESFPNESNSKLDKKDDLVEFDKFSEEEYIEYDYDLFNIKHKIPDKKIKKYKGNLGTLLQKIRKLKRKALIELSKGKPILIDQTDIYKLTFNIDLRGDKSIFNILKLKTNSHSNIRYYKIKNSIVLGREIPINTFSKEDRFYIIGVAANPIIHTYDNLAPPFLLNAANMISLPDTKELELTIQKGLSEKIEETTSHILAEVADLNKKVSTNVNDINSWIKLVNLQRMKMGPEALEKVIAECQLAVLSKAISYNPSSEELLLRQLYITYNVSDPQTLRLALDQITFNFPHKLSFWIIYLNYNQSEFSKLTHLNICNLYHKALSKIDSLRSDSVRSSQRLTEPQGSKFILRILSQFCLYLLSSDSTEKLIAMLQLLLEYNLTPNSITEAAKLNKDTIKLYLETFWDSSEPKIGDEKSHGFGHFLLKALNKRTTSIFDPNHIINWNEIFDEKILDENSNRLIEASVLHPFSSDRDLSWISLEMYRSNHNMIPCKSNNSDEIDDNERLVLFEDISNFMYRLDSSMIYELCLLYLLILGVPVPHRYCPTLSEHFYDSLIISDFVLHYPQLISQFEMITGGCTLYLKRGLSPIWMHFNIDSILTCNLPYDITSLVFIRNLFSHILSIQAWNSSHIQSFSLIWLQFEIFIALQSPSPDNSSFIKVIKLGRKLLEVQYNRSFPPLWILYSFCLIYSGKTFEYVKTMLKLINAYKSFSEQSSLYSYALFMRFFLETVIVNGLIGSENVTKTDLFNLSKKLFHHIFTDVPITEEFNPSLYTGSIIRMSNNLSNDYDEIVHATNIILCQFFSIIIYDHTAQAIHQFCKLMDWCSEACTKKHPDDKDMTKSTVKTGLLNHNTCMEYDKNSPIYTLSRLIAEQFSIFILHPAVSQNIDHCSLSTVLHRCLYMFPNSSLIQQWYYHYTQSISIAASFRIFYDKILTETYESNSTNITGWIFLIYSEISYIDKLMKSQNPGDIINLKNTSSAYRLKFLFEKILQHPQYRFRPLLWRLFMRVEKKVGDHESLKSIFYRSLQHTPWCKELYVDAINMKILDLQSIVDMMSEKGIRLRLPVEELKLLLLDCKSM